jgi:hypothetical protein
LAISWLAVLSMPDVGASTQGQSTTMGATHIPVHIIAYEFQPFKAYWLLHMRGRVTKWVTSGSKTAAMDVMPKSNVLLCPFWGKKSHKVIHKEMIPVCCGKGVSRKAVDSWVANVSLMTKRVAREVRKWLLCCGYRRTSKAVGQIYWYWWRIYREGNVFPCSNIIRFTFHTHLWPICWPPRI